MREPGFLPYADTFIVFGGKDHTALYKFDPDGRREVGPEKWARRAYWGVNWGNTVELGYPGLAAFCLIRRPERGPKMAQLWEGRGRFSLPVQSFFAQTDLIERKT